MKKIFIALFLISLNTYASEKAVLWLPYSNEELNSFLSVSADKKFSLAAAVSTKEGLNLDLIKKLKQDGKLELVNMPEGAPFATLLYYPKDTGLNYVSKIGNNPYFFALRLSDAKTRFYKDFGEMPAGLLVPYGDLNKDFPQLAQEYGYSWLAAGPREPFSGLPAIKVDSLTIVSFDLAESSGAVLSSTASFFLFDDSLKVSSGSVSALSELFAGGLGDFVLPDKLVSGLNPERAADISGFSFKSWVRDSDYLVKDEQYSLLGILAKVRNDIMSFLNSSSAKTAQVMSAYYGAEHFMAELHYTGDENSSEENLRSALEDVYQSMGKPVPVFVYKSFSDLSPEEETFAVEKSSETVSYYRLARSTGTDVFSVSTFTVAGSGDRLYFSFFFSGDRSLFRNLEIYIDMNGRIGSGSLKLVGEKKEKLIYNNAWEYALALESGFMQLYQSGYYSLIKLKKYPVKFSEDGVFFSVPASELRGNYLNWTYFPLVYSRKKGSEDELLDGFFSRVDMGYIYPVKSGK